MKRISGFMLAVAITITAPAVYAFKLDLGALGSSSLHQVELAEAKMVEVMHKHDKVSLELDIQKPLKANLAVWDSASEQELGRAAPCRQIVEEFGQVVSQRLFDNTLDQATYQQFLNHKQLCRVYLEQVKSDQKIRKVE